MFIPDVNTFIYAHRPESPRFAEHRAWLEAALTGTEPIGVSELVLSAFLRIVTNHRVFREPTPPTVALDFCTAVLNAPAALPVRPGPRHWSIFDRLCREVDARGNVVPDAYHAALAIEHGATWISSDRGFARFPGLRWALPLTVDATTAGGPDRSAQTGAPPEPPSGGADTPNTPNTTNATHATHAD